jgi:hypothetical protein
VLWRVVMWLWMFNDVEHYTNVRNFYLYIFSLCLPVISDKMESLLITGCVRVTVDLGYCVYCC